MICRHCRYENPSGACYCNMCYVPFNRPMNQKFYVSSQPKEAPKSSSGPGLGLGLFGLFKIVFFWTSMVMFVLLMRSPSYRGAIKNIAFQHINIGFLHINK